MIINYNLAFVPDVTRDNVAYVLSKHTEEPLAGIILTVHGPFQEQFSIIKAHCFDIMLHVFWKALTEYQAWILVAKHHCPDNRIIRYYGLWRHGTQTGKRIKMPQGEYSDELIQQSDSELNYFGSIRLAQQQVSTLACFFEGTDSHVVILPNETGGGIVNRIISKGWIRPLYYLPPSEIIKTVCGNEGVVFGWHGFFDDRNGVLAMLGAPHILHSLYSRIEKGLVSETSQALP